MKNKQICKNNWYGHGTLRKNTFEFEQMPTPMHTVTMFERPSSVCVNTINQACLRNMPNGSWHILCKLGLSNSYGAKA